MKLSLLRLAIVVALPFLACTSTNFSGSGNKAEAKKPSSDALPNGSDPSGPGNTPNTDQSHTVYVPLNGTKPLPGGGPGIACTPADTSIATCKDGVITGNKIGTTTIPAAPGGATGGATAGTGGGPGSAGGTPTTVVVFDPNHPPPGIDANGNQIGGLNGTSSTAGGVAATGADCLAAKADNYNIMIVLDNTGSQTFTDPTNARTAGAQSFVDQWEQFVAGHTSSRVYMGVLSFNTVSVRSAAGWILLDGASTTGDQLKQEITTATSNPSGGTAYSPVLQDAASFFQQLNVLPNADRQRNYVVFMTDGVPNAAEASQGGTSGVPSLDAALPALRANPPDCQGQSGCDDTSFDSVLVEHMSDIPPAVNALVQNYGVAIYAIASGNAVPVAGEPVVQYLAQPTTGIKFPDQVGHYFRAQSADDIRNVFTSVFSTQATCTATP